MHQSTSTPPSCFCCCFFHLNSVHSPPILFFTFSRFYFFGLGQPTSSCSVLSGFCIQHGSFNMEHCGGDEHGRKYVHSTLLFLFCPLLLSLGLCPLTATFLFFTAPTSSYMYSIPICFCIQRGSFQVEHCGGDEHGIQYVTSTSFFCCLWLFHLNSVH
jgi:hypothetical protein